MARCRTVFHCKGPVRLGGRPHSFDDVVSLGVKATVTMQDLYLSVQGLRYPIQCGVGLKIDVDAGTIPEAVDRSKYYAELILGMFCFSAKTFIDAPREQFCVDSDPSSDEHEFVQYHYFPDHLPSDSTELRGEDLTELVEGFSKGTQRQFERITRAISWCRVCLQKFALIERFTSLWLGLESIEIGVTSRNGNNRTLRKFGGGRKVSGWSKP